MDDWLDDTPEGGVSTERVKQDKSPLAVQVRKMRGSAVYKQAVARFRQECSQVRNSDGTKGAKCALCGNAIDYYRQAPHPDSFSVDHIIAASERPDLFLERKNWQPAHFGCNSSKRDSDDVLKPGCLGEASESW